MIQTYIYQPLKLIANYTASYGARPVVMESMMLKWYGNLYLVPRIGDALISHPSLSSRKVTNVTHNLNQESLDLHLEEVLIPLATIDSSTFPKIARDAIFQDGFNQLSQVVANYERLGWVVVKHDSFDQEDRWRP